MYVVGQRGLSIYLEVHEDEFCFSLSNVPIGRANYSTKFFLGDGIREESEDKKQWALQNLLGNWRLCSLGATESLDSAVCGRRNPIQPNPT
jgi:hypothetical protein